MFKKGKTNDEKMISHIMKLTDVKIDFDNVSSRCVMVGPPLA